MVNAKILVKAEDGSLIFDSTLMRPIKTLEIIQAHHIDFRLPTTWSDVVDFDFKVMSPTKGLYGLVGNLFGAVYPDATSKELTFSGRRYYGPVMNRDQWIEYVGTYIVVVG